MPVGATAGRSPGTDCPELGGENYRSFRVYLWGACHSFKTDGLQAYHLLVTRGEGPGMRPGWWYRTRNFFRNLW